MICRPASFCTLVFALGLVSCADTAIQPPAQVARTAPLVTQRAELPTKLVAASPRDQGKVTRVPLGDLFELQQSQRAVIFDVRPGFIYQLGHIPQAINWPKSRFEEDLAIHEPKLTAAKAAGKAVVLYCTDLACPDARNVATLLAARGHSVTILEGGWDAWKTGGLPIE